MIGACSGKLDSTPKKNKVLLSHLEPTTNSEFLERTVQYFGPTNKQKMLNLKLTLFYSLLSRSSKLKLKQKLNTYISLLEYNWIYCSIDSQKAYVN